MDGEAFVKILCEVEGSGGDVRRHGDPTRLLAHQTQTPSEAATPYDDLSVPSSAANVVQKLLRHSEGLDTPEGSAHDAVGTVDHSLNEGALTLAPRDDSSLAALQRLCEMRPGRPETAFPGFEVGPETAAMWMPREENEHSSLQPVGEMSECSVPSPQQSASGISDGGFACKQRFPGSARNDCDSQLALAVTNDGVARSGSAIRANDGDVNEGGGGVARPTAARRSDRARITNGSMNDSAGGVSRRAPSGRCESGRSCDRSTPQLRFRETCDGGGMPKQNCLQRSNSGSQRSPQAAQLVAPSIDEDQWRLCCIGDAGADESRNTSKALAEVIRPPVMQDMLRSLWSAHSAIDDWPAQTCESKRDTRGEWRHGELLFEETGKVCRYLVAPGADLDAGEVVQALLDPRFGMPHPDMLFSVQSSPGSCWDVEGEITELTRSGVDWPQDIDEAKDLYRRDVEGVLLGICDAAAECCAWMLGSGERVGGEGSGALFEAGIRQFMRARPEQEEDMTFLGLRGPCGPDVFANAGVKPGPECCPWSTLLNPLTGELIDLRRTSVPLHEEVTEQVRYPNVGELWTRRVSAVGVGMHEEQTLGCLCLNPTLSHFLLCTDLVRKKVQNLLEHMLPSVHVVASARNRACLERAVARVVRGAQVVVLQNTSVWSNVLAKAVFERKGMWRRAAAATACPPKLASSGVFAPRGSFGVGWSAPSDASTASGGGASATGSTQRPFFALAESAEVSKLLVFDVLKDSEERVVAKLMDTLTTIAGDDTRELGFVSAERQRVQYAWDLYVLYTLNAKRMLFWSRVAHCTITAISLLTSSSAVLLTAASLPDSDESTRFGYVGLVSRSQVRFGSAQIVFLALACSLLPLVSAFMLSVNSRFAPRTKYASFTAAAAKVRSTIYRYRSRVGEFRSSRKSPVMRDFAMDVRRRVVPRESKKLAMTSELVRPRTSSQVSELREAGNANSMRFSPSKERSRIVSIETHRARTANAVSSCPKPSERFAEVLGAIHTELMAGTARLGDLAEPTSKDREALMKKGLGHHRGGVDSHEDGRSGCCRRCGPFCAGRRRSQGRGRPSSDVQALGSSSAKWSMRSDSVGSSDEEVGLDDAVCLITADDYLHFRLRPLLESLKLRAPKLARVWAATQMISFLGAAVAGAMGVFSLREYIPIVVAVVAAMDSIAQFEQLQVRMLATNGALAEIQGLLLWWRALSMAERRRRCNKEHLINVTEDVASSEAAVLGCTSHNKVVPRAPVDRDGDQEDHRIPAKARKRQWQLS
eukprot:TRINITY_DN74636_c0_g1_i1.p1 TRINITY_DN74636_c0_g1~~TRINITY_DN74636_c0_g1_i1.p1  ORF type:complete len:1274 (-),score=196.17 TRINITY_DN74636_c0_g1_i1:424-4245(-)